MGCSQVHDVCLTVGGTVVRRGELERSLKRHLGETTKPSRREAV